MKTVDRANGRWRGILAHFGVEDRFLTGKNGPCPMCGGKDRWRFTDTEGRGLWVCNGCGGGDGMDLLMKITGQSFAELAKEIDKIVGNVEHKKPRAFDAEKAQNRIRAIMRSRASMDTVNPVRRYLKARGLKLSQALHYVPSIRNYDETGNYTVHPAMVALLSNREGFCTGMHITHLTESGEKANTNPAKKIIKAVESINGSAIRLTKLHEHIGLAEGIETALAVMDIFNLPCWATISAVGMEHFEVPEGVNRISIFADNDESFTGHKAAYNLAFRLKREGYDVDVNLPEWVGDFADRGQA